jgi:hypothetical protein
MLDEAVFGGLVCVDNPVELLEFVLECLRNHPRTVRLVGHEIRKHRRNTAVFFGIPTQREIVEGTEEGLVEPGADRRYLRSCLALVQLFLKFAQLPAQDLVVRT